MELKKRLLEVSDKLSFPEKRKKIAQLENRSSSPDFWQDPKEAKEVLRELSGLKEAVQAVERLEKAIEDTLAICEPGMEEELGKEKARIEKELEKLELTTFLSGPRDFANAIVSIHAGQGGTEAMDWAQMIFRMYLRFGQRRGWQVQVVDQTPGEEAGIKSATLFVRGPWAFGFLKGEAGTHRLVRQSPFNADRLRQTSFALVEVLPEISEPGEVEIKEEDLEWQFFRASSQGGQNVQKVSTAVRLRHKPTDIVVTAQNERYQEQNRKNALSILASKLWQRQKERQEEEKRTIKGKFHPATWGTQIRSYVLHPYKMVKDLRTGVQTSDTEAVLDGELDNFVQSQVRLLTGKTRMS